MNVFMIFCFWRSHSRIQSQPWEHVRTHLQLLMGGGQTAILRLLVQIRIRHQLFTMVSTLNPSINSPISSACLDKNTKSETKIMVDRSQRKLLRTTITLAHRFSTIYSKMPDLIFFFLMSYDYDAMCIFFYLY